MNDMSEIPFGHASGMFMDNQGMATGRVTRLDDVDMYVRDGVVSGIKVDDRYKNRTIPRDADFSEIFVPRHDVNVYCLHIFPGSEDIKKYQEILQSVYAGDAILDSVDKHPSDKGFIVMLIVNNARMVFRKEAYEEDFPEIVL